ncbi:MAG: YigZ family protein [Gemmatimonadales bacterium]
MNPAGAARYLVPAGRHRVEDVVRRSRFVTTATRASTPAAAHAFVDGVRRELPDATHHCWAFVAGPPGSTAHVGMSDDGEPHGTAGRPMLAALLHADVGEIAVVCSRWFGGVKLGTGGLARAYVQGVTHVLGSLPTTELVERVVLSVTVAYPDVDGLRSLGERYGALVQEESYGASARYRLAVPADEAARFRRELADVTKGRARVEDG